MHTVGEVTSVKCPEHGVVNFMDRYIIRKDTYWWPERLDEVEMNAKYVFISGFQMSTSRAPISDYFKEVPGTP